MPNPPLQAEPSREVLIKQFTSTDLYLGPHQIKVDFGKCGPQFTRTLESALVNYVPTTFIIHRPPISDSLQVSGSITAVNGSQNADGSFKVLLTLRLEFAIAGTGIFIAAKDAVAEGTTTGPPHNEISIYLDLEPGITKCFKTLLARIIPEAVTK
jgi:hypothetical protein